MTFAPDTLRDPTYFRGKLVELGYGQKPGAGLGFENAFPITPMDGWKVRDHQVSMSFGHQVMVSMWQQAEALSCILRGGVWKPLSLVREVRQVPADLVLAAGMNIHFQR